MRTPFRRTSKWLLGLGLVLGGSSTAFGQVTTTWTNAAGGTFNVAANWNNGVPGTLDTALYSTAGTYNITLTNSPTIRILNINTPGVNPTFLSSGGTQTLTATDQATVTNGTLTLGSPSVNLVSGGNVSVGFRVSNGTVNVQSGSSLSVAKLEIGHSAATATMNVTGAGSSLVSTLIANQTVGSQSGSTANLNISNSATANLSVGSFLVGVNTNNTSTVNVQTGASLTVGNSTIGSSGVATSAAGILNVNGAGSNITLNGASTLALGSASGSTNSGTINVTSNGSFSTGTGAVSINSTGLFDVNGGTLNLNGDTTISTQGVLSVSAGTLNLAAGKSILATGTAAQFNHVATALAINNGSSVTYQSGADGILAAYNLGTTGATSTMTLTGTGTTLTGSGASSVNIGASGILNVNSGASYTTATGQLSVAAGGQLNVSGTLNLQGPLSHNGNMTVNNGVVNAGTVNSTLQPGGVIFVSNTGNYITSNLTVNGGSFNTSGTGQLTPASTSTITATNGGIITLAHGLTANTGKTFNIVGAGSSFAMNSLSLQPGGTVNLTEGTLQVGSPGITFGGGTFNFNSGTVRYTGNLTLNSQAQTDLLGAGQTIPVNKALDVQGTATLQSQLTLNGGTFSAGTLVGGNLLNFQSGTLNLTNSGLVVGSGGTLSSVLNVGNGLTINAASSAGSTIASDGRLVLSGGTVTSFGSLTNNGEVQLTSSLTTLGGTGTLVNNSTILGTGRIEKNLTNNASGSIQVTGSDRLVFNGTTNTNAGRMDATLGGQLEFRQALTNAASTGLITGRDATLRFNGGLTNNGSLAFSNGSMDVFGDVTQNVGGRITISGGGALNFYDDVTIAPGAASVQASSVGGTVSKVVFFGSYNGGVTGGGTAFIEGDHRPGNSPGLVTFGGDVFYGSLSKLFVELGGNNRGTQYDAIDVTGSVTLSGDLTLAQINSFIPSGGSSFLIINNDGVDPIQGTFAGLAEGATFLASGNLYQVSYVGGSGNDFVISAVPEPTTWAMMGLATAGAGYVWFRRRRQVQVQWEASVSE